MKRRFRSNHPTGLNFAFAGCHVQFIRESIALDVYRAMAMIKGKELASVPQ